MKIQSHLLPTLHSPSEKHLLLSHLDLDVFGSKGKLDYPDQIHFQYRNFHWIVDKIKILNKVQKLFAI